MRLHLVDGTYELFRAHYSKRPGRQTPDGQDVKATVGLVSSLLGLLADADEAVSHIGVAFDNPIESWRNDRFEGYKSSEGVDPDLLAQFDGAEQAVAAIGVHVWSCDQHEADDVLAAAATWFRDDVDQVRILTPDKDLAQVVDGQRVVQVDRSRATVRDEAAVIERFGVAPESIPDVLALVGDTADGIPGLPGFGAKTAAQLLAHYRHLQSIPPSHEQWVPTVRGAARLADVLAERRDDVALYRELATLDTSLDPGVALSGLAWEGVPRPSYLDWCESVGVEGLRDRPHRWQE